MTHSHKAPCPGCNGTGQMTWFGGVSRFQFSYTDCPECNGFGFLDQPVDDSLRAEDLAQESGLSLEKADVFLKVLAQILSNSLQQGEKIQLRGFGSFSPLISKIPQQHIQFRPAKQLFNTIK